MSHEPPRYVHALRYRLLNAAYDPVVALTTRERRLKTMLLDVVVLSGESRVLDLGCGTGTLAVLAKQRLPGLDMHGIDGDGAMIERARRKARRAGVEAGFRTAMAGNLPYADASFTHVLTSLFLHHLTPADKRQALAEARRVLRPGGTLGIADWGIPSNRMLRGLFLIVQMLDGFETTRDHAAGRLPWFVAQAGFVGVRETGRLATVLGSLTVLLADNPGCGSVSSTPNLEQ